MNLLLIAVPLVPLAVAFGLLVTAGAGTRLSGVAGDRIRLAAGPVSVAGVALPLVFSLVGLASQGGGEAPFVDAVWFSVGSLEVPFSLHMDGFRAVMAVTVAGVSVLVHLFSIAYMGKERNYVLYFAELSFFSGAMLLLVLADNFFLLFVAWELVGAGSYLLISFYYERRAAAAAGKKAFLTTRLGDLGLLVAVWAVADLAGTLRYEEVFEGAAAGVFGDLWGLLIPLLIFAGAAGKSAQFPLHVWLPDAMEGPTPVSALIHAATMVAAGVYLVARTFPLFEASEAALSLVVWVAAFTALFSATIAVTQRDIKRVLAYSTISQLGFMMAAIGASAPEAGIFHFFTHAWFKALLFLAAGSVIHATGLQTVDELGGLARKMPLTAGTFTVGALALAGLPPFSGFWSKEEILASLARHEPVVLVMLLATSLLTAFYVFRLVFLLFFSPPKEVSVHESGRIMSAPLLALAVLSALSGFAGVSWLGSPLQETIGLETGAGVHAGAWLPVVATAVAAGGVGLAWWGYGGVRGRQTDLRMREYLGPFYVAAERGYYLDDIYRVLLIGPYLALSRFLAGVVDLKGIDGMVNGIGRLSVLSGSGLRRLQTGQVRSYVAAMAVGSLAVGVLLWGIL